MIPIKPATPHAKKLYRALKNRGVICILECWDGYKHIDICLPESKIYIEIDGNDHFFNRKKIESDIKRDQYSDNEGFKTFHYTNEFIDTHLDKIVDQIIETVERIKK
jgi:very-short-patch-repair endonuclease